MKHFLKIKDLSEKIFDYIRNSDLEVGREALQKELNSKAKTVNIYKLQKRFERNLRVNKIKRKSHYIPDDPKERVEKGLEIYQKVMNLVDIEKYK